jgi:plastocyanin
MEWVRIAGVRRRLPVAKKAVVTSVVLLALALAACGGDDDDDNGAPAGEESAAEQPAGGGTYGTATGVGETVEVSETDFAIDPANPAVDGGTVTFRVSNDGETTHNLEVEGNGIEEELEADLAPGETGELTVDLDPGTYEWYCPVGNHADLGMEGELTVR